MVPKVTSRPTPIASTASPGGLPRLVVQVGDVIDAHPGLIGARASRLARAARLGLPVPDGAVLTSAATGPIDDEHDTAPHGTTNDVLDELFLSLGAAGRRPLIVSMSPIDDDRHPAPIASFGGITTRSELLHTARRFSATASLAGQPTALIVQHDVSPIETGRFDVGPDRPASIRRSDVPSGRCNRREFRKLVRQIATAFAGANTVTWGLAASGHIWILDLEPHEHAS